MNRGPFAHFKEAWTQQRFTVMKSKWQVGEEEKGMIVSKDQRMKKEQFLCVQRYSFAKQHSEKLVGI